MNDQNNVNVIPNDAGISLESVGPESVAILSDTLYGGNGAEARNDGWTVIPDATDRGAEQPAAPTGPQKKGKGKKGAKKDTTAEQPAAPTKPTYGNPATTQFPSVALSVGDRLARPNVPSKYKRALSVGAFLFGLFGGKNRNGIDHNGGDERYLPIPSDYPQEYIVPAILRAHEFASALGLTTNGLAVGKNGLPTNKEARDGDSSGLAVLFAGFGYQERDIFLTAERIPAKLESVSERDDKGNVVTITPAARLERYDGAKLRIVLAYPSDDPTASDNLALFGPNENKNRKIMMAIRARLDDDKARLTPAAK